MATGILNAATVALTARIKIAQTFVQPKKINARYFHSGIIFL
jgi:hypothetical protein